ncbi:YkvI family membrane protein [Bacillus sp. JJ722]|uniref:YkvI family membrane protein n=1 Tax=Bacillus sp. JJ722 TaxID=3122973 RepID=UPI002FFFEB93
MKKSINLAGAYIGIIVGAGFASGQEVLQFFTYFGIYSIPAVILATILFAFLGMQIVQLGSNMQTASHKKVIYHICGRYVGLAVDVLITFFLFGVTVVMIAGSGSIFQQQFGIPATIGSIVMTVITIATLLLDIKKIMSIISIITPFLLVIMIIVAGYSFFNMDYSFSQIQNYAEPSSAAASNWVMGSLLYVSYNIAAGIAMLIVMGGTFTNKKEAGWGGVLGGIGLGVLLFLINLGMLSDMPGIQGVDMPTLFLANEISPILGNILSIVLLGMVYNTAVGMLYAFTARFAPIETKTFKASVVVIGILAFLASFVGFITLVGTVYPVTGYIGFIVIIAVIISWFRSRKQVGALKEESVKG